MQTVLLVTLLVVSLVNLTLGVVVLASGRRSWYGNYFFGLSTAVFCWTAGIALFLGANSVDMAVVAAKAYYIGAAIIGYCLLGLALTLPDADQTKHSRFLLLFLALPLFGVSSMFLPWDAFIKEVIFLPTGNEVVLAAYPYAVYTLYFMGYIVAAVYIIARKYFRARQLGKKIIAAQLGLVVVGLFTGGLFGVLFNLFLPLFGNYRLIWAGPLFSVVLVILTFYAIIRHGLFDVRRALAQTIAYILSIISVGVLYSLGVFAVSLLLFGGEQLTLLQSTVNILLAIILAFSFQPLKSFFDRLTDKIFFRYDYNLQDVLNTVGDITTYEINLKQVASKVASFIRPVVKAAFVAVYIEKAPTNYYHSGVMPPLQNSERLITLLRRHQSKIIVPHRLEASDDELRELLEVNAITLVARLDTSRELIGFMYYGEKLSGSFYNTKDIQVVRTAAGELALAVQNSLRFAEISKFNETLQAKVDVATEKLRNTNQKLKQLDAAKDEFVSMASHQLRTPLTSIKGYLSMVIDGDAGKLNATQEKLLKEAYTSSERMVRLIGDFLNVSRLRTGKFIIETAEVDLAKLVTEEVVQLQGTAASRQQQLEYQAPTDLPLLCLDHNKIQQVIMNFIDNAIFYSHAGGIITVTLMKDAKNVTLRVKDSGIGVPKKERQHLFTKFFRASNARRQRPDGTGIGLFMAQKIIVAHGGSIIFESEEGMGSTFGFRLPLEVTGKKHKK